MPLEITPEPSAAERAAIEAALASEEPAAEPPDPLTDDEDEYPDRPEQR
jgi:hypothetical protein